MTGNKKFENTRLIYLVCFIVFGTPFLMGYGTLPMTNFAGEAMSFVGAALLLILVGFSRAFGGNLSRELLVAISAVLLLAVAAVVQFFEFEQRNADSYLVVLGYLTCAALIIWAGNAACSGAQSAHWVQATALSFAIGGALAALASLAQYFHINGQWVVLSSINDAGRTYGFLRQPNHQGTYLSLGLVATLVLYRTDRLPSLLWLALSSLLILGIVTTGSRTALVQIAFISVCGLISDRRGRRRKIQALWPLLAAACLWLLLFILNRFGGIEFYGAEKLAQTSGEGIGLRSGIWHHTIVLILEHPWAGNGVLRFPAVFLLRGAAMELGTVMSNSHNLILQLAFDYGVLVAGSFLSAMAWVLWRARGFRATDWGLFAYAALGCLLIHSLVEFPLWYSYFLIPACFFLGWLTRSSLLSSVGVASNPGDADNSTVLPLIDKARAVICTAAGAVIVAAIVWMNHDYYLLTPAYIRGPMVTLQARLVEAERVFWFYRFAQFPWLQLNTVSASNYQPYLERTATMGCVMGEPWFQLGTLLALAYAGKTDEAKWLLYIHWRLSKGNVEQIKAALAASKVPAATELLAYLNDPKPVRPALGTFEEQCYGRRS
ncbi:Wzy polymerase domain-containing protein [Polaromonas sp.]|uniref:PglL family O-oligosaccharyltransferase n=1 Tax=Polaromonas sp. TaxID=1869339 RepID=UPI003BAD75DA